MLQGYGGVVIGEEDRLPGLQDRNRLPMDPGRVKYESRACGPGELHHAVQGQVLDLPLLVVARNDLAVAPLDVLEAPGADIGEENGELDLAGNAILNFVLIEPAIAVPAVEIP